MVKPAKTPQSIVNVTPNNIAIHIHMKYNYLCVDCRPNNKLIVFLEPIVFLTASKFEYYLPAHGMLDFPSFICIAS